MDDIKLGDIDKIDTEQPARPTKHIHYKQEDNGAGTIAMAIIAAAVIGIGGWIGYKEYKEEQARRNAITFLNEWNSSLEKTAERERHRSKEIAEQMRQRRIERELSTERGIDRIREKQVAEMKAKERKEQCSFWTKQHRNNPTQGTRAMLKTYCE